MNLETNNGHAAAAATERAYDLCHPVIRPGRRRALEEIHHSVAARWSELLSDALPDGGAIVFEAIGIETFGQFVESVPADAQVSNFELERTSAGGFLVIDGTFLRALVDARMGGACALDAADAQARPFTRLESVIVRELQCALVDALAPIYRARGLGAPASVHHGEPLGDNLLLSPDDRMVLFRFGLDSGAQRHVITVGAKVAIVEAVEAASPDGRAQVSPTIAKCAAELPVEIDLVLGSWDVPLEDLAALAPGEVIVLPEGDDAWLASGTVELRRVHVSVSGRRIIIAPAEGSDDDAQG